MATTKLWTVEELEREGVPEGRWELIDGELVQMPPTCDRASSVANTFAYFITDHVRPRRLGRVYSADGGFVLFPDHREQLRAPDVAFVRADRLPPDEERDRFPRLAPDLVVEVISPTDLRDAVQAKVELWLAAGARLLWLVDPRARTVTVFTAGHEPITLGVGDILDGGEVLPEFRVAVAECFD
jgi:Uma2 family endonuclease